MLSPASKARAVTRPDLPLEVAPPPKAATLKIPNVSIPLHPPGHPLPVSTAVMEASTAAYFCERRSPQRKRHRSALVDEASTSAASSILAIVSAEEDIHAMGAKDIDGGSVGHRTTQLKASAVPGDAVTARYLAELFGDPVRSEQDVYRIVDVAHCRRVLAQEVDMFERAMTSEPLARSSLEGPGRSTQRAKRVSELNSCLTTGQHRRYRGHVLEWLRHQPSPAPPPNSAEVLKVVQQEQRLFLEVLRQEVLSHSVKLPSDRNTTIFAYLGSALTSFAQYRRMRQMRQHLISFLDDAKKKRSEGRLLLGSAPVVSASVASGVTEEDNHNGDGAHNFTDDLPQDVSHGATPLQLFQRRFPSLRVLQWHLVKLYNAHQNGVAVSFPNPQVRSFEVLSKEGADALPLTRPSETDTTTGASSSVTEVAQRLPVSLLPASPFLSLASLPQYSQADDSDQPETEDKISVSAAGDSRDTMPCHAVPSFATHLPVDVASASLTLLSTAALHEYVSNHLLPRFGWQVSRHPGKDAQSIDDGGTRIVESVSLSISFEAMLKLFVAHVDTQEPRTAFRIPLCVHVTPKSDLSHIADAAPARVAYHAHVMVGAAVPNVTESRHSVHVAAAEYLILHNAGGGGSRSNTVTRNDDQGLSGVPMEAKKVAAGASTVHLLRTAFAPCDSKPRQAAAQSVTGAASGDAISASVEKLLVQQEPSFESAVPLVFCVAAPVGALAPAGADGDSLRGAALVVKMAKIEHLNVTSAVEPHKSSLPSKAHPSTTDAKPTVALLTETAAPCRWLLEMLSPREMLQLDLLFACFPRATVLLHRVQLSGRCSEGFSPDANDNKEGEVERAGMEVLAVEELTLEKWGLSRQQLERRPAESLITTPSPAEVLATSSWDLLYDTLAWMLDTTARRVAYALESEEGDVDITAGATNHTSRERYMYLVLSNHANLVNTSASTKLYTKKRPESAPDPFDTTVIASSYTESRFAVRYVVQDAVEIYPDYEPKVPIAIEVENLRFLEILTPGCSDDDDDDDEGDTKPWREKEKRVSRVATRLYRDPHTWNSEMIPFTLPRRSEGTSSSMGEQMASHQA